MKKRKSKNMYQKSVKQLSPFVGCNHWCTYCADSFQRQAKRQRHICSLCADFEVHYDHFEKRLQESPPRTAEGEFIFLCANGDVAFCDDEHFKRLIEYVREHGDRTFLIQSKDPGRAFLRIKEYPSNLILGITLETNRDAGYERVSSAPKPSKRYADFVQVQHNRKMVTIEPVLAFDLDELTAMVVNINPCMVWLGYNSKTTKRPPAPTPTILEFYSLNASLTAKGFKVILKTTTPNPVPLNVPDSTV